MMTWVNLNEMMLSEINQAQKISPGLTSMWNTQSNLKDAESRKGIPRRCSEGRGGGCWSKETNLPLDKRDSFQLLYNMVIIHVHVGH